MIRDMMIVPHTLKREDIPDTQVTSSRKSIEAERYEPVNYLVNINATYGSREHTAREDLRLARTYDNSDNSSLFSLNINLRTTR